MPVYKGAYSGDFKESNLMEDELNWMPSNSPTGKPIRDTQPRIRKGPVIDDKDGGGFSGPMRKKN